MDWFFGGISSLLGQLIGNLNFLGVGLFLLDIRCFFCLLLLLRLRLGALLVKLLRRDLTLEERAPIRIEGVHPVRVEIIYVGGRIFIL